MDDNDLQRSWDGKADEWDFQVGEGGDRNRVLHSDPVLWRLLGEVADRDVLDAGCGTGYLCRQLANKRARVVGVDFSPAMIEIARRKTPDKLAVAFRVDSCAELATCATATFDLLVANYVLMDLAELDATVHSFYRVLRDGGAAVLIFSHPCFPQANAERLADNTVRYRFDFNYFVASRQQDPPWRHFTSPFVWFHRPLSAYWRAFRNAGFVVDDFDEPHLTPERRCLAVSERERFNGTHRPYSVAFRLVKPLARNQLATSCQPYQPSR